MQPISRRRFVALSAAGVAVAPLSAKTKAFTSSITAQEVADRIRKSLGDDWKPDTIDGIKAGAPSTLITGIATTSLASMAVLDKAVRTGANMIFTTEPAFYNHADVQSLPVRPTPSTTSPPPSDPVIAGKAEFIRKHNLVLYRLSEHWRSHVPDPYATGLARMLSWSMFASISDPHVLNIPEMTLRKAVTHIKRSLKARGGIRVVGNADLRVRKVGLLPGSTPLEKSIAMLPHVDMILAGEFREWEGVEYVRDAVDISGKKALVLVGRVLSEDPGMNFCADWLKSVVPELSATWISAGDPYWRPAR